MSSEPNSFNPYSQNFAELLVRQLERHVNDRGGIHRLAVTQSWFETDLVGRGDRSFVQSVAHSADDLVHVQRSCGGETDFKQNLAFQLQVARFLRIHRVRLERDLDR